MTGDQPDTRRRLLAAATPLFADRGFDAVPVRDICQAASVNVAAVNYHFGSKEGLYLAVIESVMTLKRDRYLQTVAPARQPGPGALEDLLQSFFLTHFADTLKDPRGVSFIKLLSREIHQGHPERMQRIQSLLAPLWSALQHALQQVEPDLDDTAATWAVGSLHGQLIHFTMRWLAMPTPDQGEGRFLPAVFPPLADDVDQYIAQATQHITRFSAAGIRALARPAAPSGPSRKDPS